MNKYFVLFGRKLRLCHTYIMILLFLELMSDDQEWKCQSRSKENGKPSSQTVDIFKLEWQILNEKEQMNNILIHSLTHTIM